METLTEKIKILFLDDEFHSLIKETLINIESKFKHVGVSSFSESYVYYELILNDERICFPIHTNAISKEYEIRIRHGIHGVINILSRHSMSFGCHKNNKELRACIERLAKKLYDKTNLTSHCLKEVIDKEILNCLDSSYGYYLKDKEEYCIEFLKEINENVKSHLLAANYDKYMKDKTSEQVKEQLIKVMYQALNEEILSLKEIIALAKEAEIKAIHNK